MHDLNGRAYEHEEKEQELEKLSSNANGVHDSKKPPEDEDSKGFCLRIFYRYRGIILSFLAALAGSLAQITIRKAKNFSGSEHSILRNIMQLIAMSALIRYHKLEYWGPKKARKIIMFRGIIGAASLLSWSFAAMLIPPSDIISLIYVSIVITAIISRIILKEMLGFAHIISIILTLAGVFLIAQPEFLFKPSNNFNVSAEWQSGSNQTTAVNLKSSNNKIMSIVGIMLSLSTAFFSGMAPIVIRYLLNQNVHFSVMTNYAALVGLPASIILELFLVFSNIHTKSIDLFRTNLSQFLFELMLSFVTGLLSLGNQIFFNLSIHYEDPTKCTIIRSSEVFLVFIWQRLFLGMRSNLTSILGAVFIFLGALGVILYKLLDKKYAPVNTDPSQQLEPASKFRKCFFYKI